MATTGFQLFIENELLFEKLRMRDFLNFLHKVRQDAKRLGVNLPWPLLEVGRFVKFFEYDVTCESHWVKFISFHTPADEMLKKKWYQFCAGLAVDLENWQGKEKGFYSFAVEKLTGVYDDWAQKEEEEMPGEMTHKIGLLAMSAGSEGVDEVDMKEKESDPEGEKMTDDVMGGQSQEQLQADGDSGVSDGTYVNEEAAVAAAAAAAVSEKK